MKHLYIKGKDDSDRTLILFHEAGGRETDLLEVAAMVNSSADILSFRGNVEEEGQARFFKLTHADELDWESLEREGDKLADEIISLSRRYGIDLEKAVCIGYSDGASMAAHLLLNHELPVTGAILHHPAHSIDQIENYLLLETAVLLTAGAGDMDATASEAYELKKQLELRGASAEVKLTEAGHEIISEELMEGRVWYTELDLDDEA